MSRFDFVRNVIIAICHRVFARLPEGASRPARVRIGSDLSDQLGGRMVMHDCAKSNPGAFFRVRSGMVGRRASGIPRRQLNSRKPLPAGPWRRVIRLRIPHKNFIFYVGVCRAGYINGDLIRRDSCDSLLSGFAV